MRQRKSRDEWASIIAALETSGQSVERFCKRQRIAPATLRWWRWTLRGSASMPLRQGPRLLAVDVAPVDTTVASVAPDSIAIDVSDLEVRVEVGTDVAYVARLVAELRRGC